MRTSFMKVLAAAAGSLVAVEALTRIVLLPQSGDLSRLRDYPRQADSLQQCSGARVAVMGNSMVERGVDFDLLRRELDALGIRDDCVDAYLADGSGMTTWRAMVRNFFWSRANRVDVLAIVSSGPGLGDEPTPDAGRLGRYLTSGHEWRAVFTTDSLPASVAADMAVSSLTATFAVRKRLFRRLAAGWRGTPPSRSAETRGSQALTYHALGEVARSTRDAGTVLLIAVFPVQGEPPPDPSVVASLTSAGARVVDMGDAAGLEGPDYATPAHLTASGRDRFTRSLALPLAEAIEAARIGVHRAE